MSDTLKLAGIATPPALAREPKLESYSCSACGQDWALEDWQQGAEHVKFDHVGRADLLATYYAPVAL